MFSVHLRLASWEICMRMNPAMDCMDFKPSLAAMLRKVVPCGSRSSGLQCVEMCGTESWLEVSRWHLLWLNNLWFRFSGFCSEKCYPALGESKRGVVNFWTLYVREIDTEKTQVEWMSVDEFFHFHLCTISELCLLRPFFWFRGLSVYPLGTLTTSVLWVLPGCPSSRNFACQLVDQTLVLKLELQEVFLCSKKNSYAYPPWN